MTNPIGPPPPKVPADRRQHVQAARKYSKTLTPEQIKELLASNMGKMDKLKAGAMMDDGGDAVDESQWKDKEVRHLKPEPPK